MKLLENDGNSELCPTLGSVASLLAATLYQGNLIGTISSGISYHLRDIYSICMCCRNVADSLCNELLIVQNCFQSSLCARSRQFLKTDHHLTSRMEEVGCLWDIYSICRCCRNVATYKWKVHNGNNERQPTSSIRDVKWWSVLRNCRLLAHKELWKQFGDMLIRYELYGYIKHTTSSKLLNICC
jgi:hypothetical protein